MVAFNWKLYFSCLIYKIKVTWKSLDHFLIFVIFIVNAFFSQFFSRGIRMHILTLTRVQNGHISRWKNGQILIKNLLLEVNFQDARPLYGNCFSYIIAITSSVVAWVCRFMLEVNFQDGRPLYGNCFSYIIAITSSVVAWVCTFPSS